ncbi:MAG: hypothetical protein K0U98_04960 [Deltaproteobacteria bacterium]|nr:hypothetical protein [Deltaproteobacteria bacterium]
MSEKKGVVDEAASGVAVMFGRLGEFFHIFDLSFFVAGASTVGALLFLGWRSASSTVADLPLLVWLSGIPSGWRAGLALMIACYICGLATFSLGRALNGQLFRRQVLQKTLTQALKGQQLKGPIVANFLDGKAPKQFPRWRLYIRLWQQLAANHSQSVAFTHLSRYWAMAATYDGVAASLLVWAMVVSPITGLGLRPFQLWPSVAAMVALACGALLCFRQGGKYYEFQIEDLVAALAVMKKEVD